LKQVQSRLKSGNELKLPIQKGSQPPRQIHDEMPTEQFWKLF